MAVCVHQDWIRRCKIFAIAVSGLTAGLGLLLFFLWLSGNKAQLPADISPTSPYASIGLFLAGAALWLLREPFPPKAFLRPAQTCAGILGLLGAAALLEFATVWDFSPKKLAAAGEILSNDAALSYAMAPVTALSFVLLSLAFFFLGSQRRSRGSLSQTFVLIAAALNLLAVASYFDGPEALQRIAAFTSATLPGVFLVLLLCAGILCARPDRGIALVFTSDHPGGVLMRRLLPFAILVPVLLASFRLLAERMGIYPVGFGMALFATALIFCFLGLVWWSAARLNQVDVEQRRASEELGQCNAQLQRDNEFFRGIAETVPGFLFTWTGDGSNTFACPHFYERTGLEAGSAAGEGWIQAIHPDDRTPTKNIWENAQQNGEPIEIRHRFQTTGGDFHWVLTRACSVREDAGEVCTWFGFSTDIEEEHRNQAKLEAAVAERTAELQQRARQLSSLASDLTLTEQRERRRLAQVLHDNLQQLLVAARFNLNILHRNSLPENALAATAEVDSLLEESIAVSRSLTVELSPPVLHDVGLEAAMEWLGRWFEEKQGLGVELAVDSGLAVEREDLRLILFGAVRELLFNVTKHAKVDTARVELHRIPGQDEIEVTVSDDGIGFAPEPALDNGSGGGFGLFSIRERIHILGGRFTMKSAPGAGTRVCIIIPLKREKTGGMDLAEAASNERGAGLPADAPAMEPREEQGAIRLLLADDHSLVRQGLQAMLSPERDIRVVGEAGDGEEAVELARQLRPDIVLMDFSMPRLNGVQATEKIRQDLPEVQVIGLSMFEEEDRARAMMAAGAKAYLSKSSAADVLLGAIRKVASSPVRGDDSNSDPKD